MLPRINIIFQNPSIKNNPTPLTVNTRYHFITPTPCLFKAPPRSALRPKSVDKKQTQHPPPSTDKKHFTTQTPCLFKNTSPKNYPTSPKDLSPQYSPSIQTVVIKMLSFPFVPKAFCELEYSILKTSYFFQFIRSFNLVY